MHYRLILTCALLFVLSASYGQEDTLFTQFQQTADPAQKEKILIEDAYDLIYRSPDQIPWLIEITEQLAAERESVKLKALALYFTGRLESIRGNLDSAIALYLEARKLLHGQPESMLLTRCYSSLAYVTHHKGDFNGQLEYLDSATGRLMYNPADHLIYYYSAIGDTLWMDGNVYTSSHPYKQPIVIRLDTNLKVKDHKIYDMSTYGGLFKQFMFNPVNNKIYASGSWGDTFNLAAPAVITGHPGTVQNAFVLRMDGFNVEAFRTFRPTDITRYTATIQFFEMNINAAGDVHLGGYIWDSTFVSEDTALRFSLSSHVVERKSMYLSMDKDLKLKQTVYPEDDKSVGFIYGIAFDPYNGRTYLSGKIAGDYELGSLAVTTPGGRFDAALMALGTDSVTIPDGIAEFKSEGVMFYPNPVDNEIHFHKNVKNASVFGNDGRKLLSATPKENSIDVSALSPGLYFIMMETGNTTVSKKFIKN